MDIDQDTTESNISSPLAFEADPPQQPEKSNYVATSLKYPLSLAKILNPEHMSTFAPEDLVNDIMNPTQPPDSSNGNIEPSEKSMDAAETCSGDSDGEEPRHNATETSLHCSTATIHSDDVSYMDAETLDGTADMGKEVASSTKTHFLGYFKKSHDHSPSNKRPRSPSDDTSFVSSSNASTREPAKKKVGVESIFGPTGISKSAQSSRETRDAAKRGEFVVNRAKEARWRKSMKEADPQVAFFKDDVSQATHFACGKTIRVKEPYDTTRFRKHVDGCKGDRKKSNASGRTHSLLDLLSTGKWGGQSRKHEKTDEERVPCQGLSEVDNELIPVYLRRSTATGGGARSVTMIALERFRKKFRRLSKKEKDVVDDIQQLEHQWRNDHANLRIFATTCERWIEKDWTDRLRHCKKCHLLLSNGKFKVMLRKPVPEDENFIYVNKRFRNSVLGEQYARAKGLKNVIESAVRCKSFMHYTLAHFYHRMQNIHHLSASQKEH
jgi:hypothetical protein